MGGEGFSNVGEVQFVQDATLERYLEAAKKVASHAIVGSGRSSPHAGVRCGQPQISNRARATPRGDSEW